MELGKRLRAKRRTSKAERREQQVGWMRAALALVEEHDNLIRVAGAAPRPVGAAISEGTAS